MKVTILIENLESEEYEYEHGLCIHIEYKRRSYLLDTGRTDAFIKNAEKMNISVPDIDMGFLSHAHYDHSGGYHGFFHLNKKADIFLQENAVTHEHLEIKQEKMTDIGIPEGVLESYPDRFKTISENVQIDPGVYLIRHSTNGMEKRGETYKMYQEKDGVTTPDDFSHEQSVVFRTNEGLVVFNSCSHGGVENIVPEIMEAFPEEEIAAVIGGFHLMGAKRIYSMGPSEETVRKLGETLKSYPVKQYYSGHCTGLPAYDILKDVLGDRMEYIYTGRQITFTQD